MIPPVTGPEASEIRWDDVLEALDLSAAQPGLGLLERVFSRFNARVPFETVSKILRNQSVAQASEKPRDPGVFWNEHLAWGAGGTCFARVAAFEALLAQLGFRSQKILGRVERDFDHAALCVETDHGAVLADVGFPLPALLPAREGVVETALKTLEVTPTARGWRVRFAGGVPDGPRELELFAAPVDAAQFGQHWRETFRPGSRFLTRVGISRLEENRAVSFAGGELRIDDLHSRLRLPVSPPRAEKLEEVFRLGREPLAGALALLGDPDSPLENARLTAYLQTGVPAAEAFQVIATGERYRRLMEGVAQVSAVGETEGGWRMEFSPPGSAPSGSTTGFSEEVFPFPAEKRLEVRRTAAGDVGKVTKSSFEVAEFSGEAYLVRSLSLTGAREDLLRNDSARGRLAGTLAIDLLAWARMLPSS